MVGVAHGELQVRRIGGHIVAVWKGASWSQWSQWSHTAVLRNNGLLSAVPGGRDISKIQRLLLEGSWRALCRDSAWLLDTAMHYVIQSTIGGNSAHILCWPYWRSEQTRRNWTVPGNGVWTIGVASCKACAVQVHWSWYSAASGNLCWWGWLLESGLLGS